MALYNPKKLSSLSGVSSPSADPMRKQGFLIRRQKTKQNLAASDAASRGFYSELMGEIDSFSIMGDAVKENSNQWQELQNKISEIKDKPSETEVNLNTELSDVNVTFPDDLYGKKGTGSKDVVSYSHYNDPIPEEGFTRNAGGAPKEAQEKAIKTIIYTGKKLQATEEEIAMALAIARHESGFNIFAAATSSSAYGLGQFIDKTGKAYGLTQENRDDLEMQAQALIEFTQYNFDLTRKRGKGIEFVYKYHHDGPEKNSGGLAIGRKNVMPYYPRFLKMIRGQEVT
jgi:hypothetical protein